MSQAEPETPGRKRGPLFYVLAGSGVLLAALFAWLTLGGTPATSPKNNRTESGGENNLELARQGLARETDLNSCRTAVQQLNTYFRQYPRFQAPPLETDQKKRLQKFFGLDEGSLAEIESSPFTLLDTHHLDECFLLRDAALSLQAGGVAAKGADGKPVRRQPLEQAAAAFTWVMDQVRDEERAAGPGTDPGLAGPAAKVIAPPAFALRRGWGSPLERALVFLALLRQVAPATELQGCLVYCPGAGREGDAPAEPGDGRLWACGVVVEGGPDVFLFDPRLGLPIPGPHGKGIATLAQAAQNAEVLRQLTVQDAHRYDVTAAQASAAELRLVCPLSALAPRMRYLQDQLLPPVVRVNLAVNPFEDLERLQKAARREGGKEFKVGPWQEPVVRGSLAGPGLLQRFLPPEEGGSTGPGEVPKLYLFQVSFLPLQAMPELFRDEIRFPPNVGLGRRIREAFVRPFVESVLDPGKPRNLILRGRFGKAARELTLERGKLAEQMQHRQRAQNLDKRVAEWSDRAITLYAAQLNPQLHGSKEALQEIEQQITQLWSMPQVEPILIMLYGATARPRDREAVYLLALCKHCEAEQIQARLDLQARAGGPSAAAGEDARLARQVWHDAADWWQRYADEYPGEPGNGAARRLRGRALAMLGRRDEAAALWENLSPPLTPMGQVAGLYLARQIRGEKEKGNGSGR
jgi:hypothetical protein